MDCSTKMMHPIKRWLHGDGCTACNSIRMHTFTCPKFLLWHLHSKVFIHAMVCRMQNTHFSPRRGRRAKYHLQPPDTVPLFASGFFDPLRGIRNSFVRAGWSSSRTSQSLYWQRGMKCCLTQAPNQDTTDRSPGRFIAHELTRRRFGQQTTDACM